MFCNESVNKSVLSVEPRHSALNMMLPTFAASLNVALAQGTQQQTSHTPLSIDGKQRQMDGQPIIT